MHDQKKIKESEIDAKTRQLEAEKIAKFRELYAECMTLRDANTVTTEALGRVNVLLEVNPELYTMYNYRRRILVDLWTKKKAVGEESGSQAGEEDAEVKTKLLLEEMQLSNRIIQKEYKCYAAWLHRKWVLRHLPPATRLEILVKENLKCQALLKVDERNFHVWGYRRWVTNQLVGTPHYDDKTELAYTESKIGSNFSNYSAWHNRALVFNSLIAEAKQSGKKNDDADGAKSAVVDASTVDPLISLYEKESELVVKSMYCDPEDQSAWLYSKTQLYAALRTIANDIASSSDDDVKAKAIALYEQCIGDAFDACEELLTTEEDDAKLKWPRWLMVHLLSPDHISALENKWNSDASSVEERLGGVDVKGKREQLIGELCAIDSQRSGYFKDLLVQS